MIEARLHSIETMGLLDGPGIRTVFFLQGCPLRCSYCHNPDSQSMFSKKRIKPQEVVDIAKRYKTYYDKTGGGVTFSGGEPLLHGEFLLETIKLLNKEGIKTAIDTSAYGDSRFYKEIIRNVDVILLDIKHYDNVGYRELTGKSMGGFYKFISYLKEFNGILWVRHVMLPTITDDEKSVNNLFDAIRHLSDKIDRFEILPYNKMGLEKYENLNIEYTLDKIPEMDKERAKYFEEVLSDKIDNEKREIHRQKKII